MLASATAVAQQSGKLTEDEARAIGTEAYIYGYPLVTMEMTRRVMTNAAKPEGTRAPMGQFVNMRKYPDASFKDVTTPNADTLYSSAFLDLTREPYVLSLPDEHDRYFLMPMLSGWTDVFESPGKRTTGTDAQTYVITGPGWKGTVPQGMKQYKSPTNMVWVLGRTYSTGTPEDYKQVHALQDQYKLVALSAYGKTYTPPAGKVDPTVDMKTPVRDQVNRMSAQEFFSTLARLLKENPPAAADAPMVAKLKRLGIERGRDFDWSKADPAVQKGLQGVPKTSQEKMVAAMKSQPKKNGWSYTTETGSYGTDYLQRATIAYFGLGANLPEDAVYPTAAVDANGRPFDGANKYVLHFDKGEMPPVRGFWSLTMYNPQLFFVANPLNRYAISSRDKLKQNPDGSMDIYIQRDSPGKDKESNWLPAPAGQFVLTLRMYWPNENPPSIVDGSWTPPAVKQVTMTSEVR
jgi:hypothetical protein